VLVISEHLGVLGNREKELLRDADMHWHEYKKIKDGRVR
jgi:hypothetical protein